MTRAGLLGRGTKLALYLLSCEIRHCTLHGMCLSIACLYIGIQQVLGDT